MILLDTNLLGRMTDSTDPQCAASRRAVHVLSARRERLIIFSQCSQSFRRSRTRGVTSLR
jgi:hypothetical protein